MEDIVEKVAKSFRHTDILHRRILEKSVQKTGIYRSQHHLLMIISHNKLASQKELADQLEISTTAVAVSLKKLENGGYVKKVVDSKDNRFNKIDLTEKGLEVVKQSHEIFYSIDKNMFEGFTDEEKNNMLNYLDKMYSNLARMEADFKNESEEK